MTVLVAVYRPYPAIERERRGGRREEGWNRRGERRERTITLRYGDERRKERKKKKRKERKRKKKDTFLSKGRQKRERRAWLRTVGRNKRRSVEKRLSIAPHCVLCRNGF